MCHVSPTPNLRVPLPSSSRFHYIINLFTLILNAFRTLTTETRHHLKMAEIARNRSVVKMGKEI